MKKIDIYTSSTCKYCHMAKDFFKENDIPFTEHNVSENPEARKELMKKGYMSVPVIIVDGEEMVGFDQEKLKELLGL